MTQHRFEILIDGKIQVYTKYEEIPQEIDNVICFIPNVPDPPHSEEEHEEIESWNYKLKELMKRERK